MGTREQRMYYMYRVMKRKGRFHYDEFGQSPWLHIARAFKLPIREVKDIIKIQREGNMQIYQVSPHDVEPCRPAAVREIKVQKQRLEDEGQIEPITVVHYDNRLDGTPLLRVRDKIDDWLYASAQVIAAQELNWPTILVTY